MNLVNRFLGGVLLCIWGMATANGFAQTDIQFEIEQFYQNKKLDYEEYKALTELALEPEINCLALSVWIVDLECSPLESKNQDSFRSWVTYQGKTNVIEGLNERQKWQAIQKWSDGRVRFDYAQDENQFVFRQVAWQNARWNTLLGNFSFSQDLPYATAMVLPRIKNQKDVVFDFWQNSTRSPNGFAFSWDTDLWRFYYFTSSLLQNQGKYNLWHQGEWVQKLPIFHLGLGLDYFDFPQNQIYPKISVSDVHQNLLWQTQMQAQNHSWLTHLNFKKKSRDFRLNFDVIHATQSFDGIQWDVPVLGADTNSKGFYLRAQNSTQIQSSSAFQFENWQWSQNQFLMLRHDSLWVNRLKLALIKNKEHFRPQVQISFPHLQNPAEQEYHLIAEYGDDHWSYLLGHLQTVGQKTSQSSLENQPSWLGVNYKPEGLVLGLKLKLRQWDYQDQVLQWIQTTRLHLSESQKLSLALDWQWDYYRFSQIQRPIVNLSLNAQF